MMPGKMNDPDTIPENIMKFGGDAEEDQEIRASSGEGYGQVSENIGSG